MAREFAGSMMDGSSGMVMLGSTALALLAGLTVGPPSTDAIAIGLLVLGTLVAMFFGAWAVRLWRVGRIASAEDDLFAPHFAPPLRLFFTLWLGLAGASTILFIAGLISLPTGIATSAVVSAFFYVVAVWMMSRCIGGTFINLAILRSA